MSTRKYQYKEFFRPGIKYAGLGDNCIVRMYPHTLTGRESWAVTLMRSGLTFFRPATKGNAAHMMGREGVLISKMEWWEEPVSVEDAEIIKYASLLLTKGQVVYFAEAKWAGQIKIGYTTDIESRHQGFLVDYPLPVNILALLPGGVNVESAMHSRFAHLRQHNQWFTDCPELREYIASL